MHQKSYSDRPILGLHVTSLQLNNSDSGSATIDCWLFYALKWYHDTSLRQKLHVFVIVELLLMPTMNSFISPESTSCLTARSQVSLAQSRSLEGAMSELLGRMFKDKDKDKDKDKEKDKDKSSGSSNSFRLKLFRHSSVKSGSSSGASSSSGDPCKYNVLSHVTRVSVAMTSHSLSRML